MYRYLRYTFIFSLLIVCLLGITGCSKETGKQRQLNYSFGVIEELCKGNFAPGSQEVYEKTYKKYEKQPDVITKFALQQFYDYPNKTISTDVTMTDYRCQYVDSPELGCYYEAFVSVKSNRGVYANLRLTFYVKDGAIYQVYIFNADK